MLDVFDLPFAQRALWVLLLLAVAGGLLGTWIVLRGLAFYSHAVGTAAFPGLVVAEGVGFAAAVGAAGAAGVFGACVWLTSRGRRTSSDSATAIVLAGFLALGVILASDVFESGRNIETLLFGSLLVIDGGDIALAAAAAAVALGLTLVLGPRWLARGFDPEQAGRSRAPDAALLAAVAFAAIAALALVGALLATALLVVPAATTRLWFHRLRSWQLATVLLTAAEGVVGIWLAVETNAPPGATIAVLAGGAFALSAAAKLLPKQAVAPTPLALALALALLSGCGSEAASGDAPRVVATTPIVADMARAVAGDRADVEQLLQPNTDPHDYEPRPGDVQAVADARLVLTNGLGLDDWAGGVVDRSGGDPEVVDLSERLPVRRGDDPHWFQDPRNARAAVERIRDALIEADPDGAQTYRARARDYLTELATLDESIQTCFEQVSPARRKLVTDHDAFGYFASRYGIDVVGAVIPGQTTQAQPSAADTKELADLIEREDVQAIFPEESLNPRLAEALADQTGVTAEHQLYGDTLGPEGSSGATYVGMQRANADSMVRGFTGDDAGCAR